MKKKKRLSYKHFTYTERLQIEAWLRVKTPVAKMAKLLGKSRGAVYAELKRGKCELRATDWTMYTSYSATIAEDKYRRNLQAKGADLKIGNDFEYANFLAEKIKKDRYSPVAAIAEAEKIGSFQTKISYTTLYRYIDMGIFFQLSNKDLPVKGKRKARKASHRAAAKAPAGISIEKRDPLIDTREDSGHWEMDTVVGGKNKGAALLVLTERKTRREIIRLMPSKTKENVVRALDQIERKIGKKQFRKVFKTITVDNGAEFQDVDGMERSRVGGTRTTIYYCHPYSSFERGSNENQNKLVRRWFPKGISFDKVRKSQIQALEDWINNYPRRLFCGNSTADICIHDKLMQMIC